MNAKVVKIGTFIVKHAIAAGFVIGGAVALTVALYFGFLLWAVFTNGGVGGPLALPAMILLVFIYSVGSVVVILFPITAVTELICSRGSRRSRFVQIPIASALLVTYLAAAILFLAFLRNWSLERTLRGAVTHAVLQLLLLGVYWWALQGAGLVLSAGAKLCSAVWRAFKRRREAAV